jgi:hypothetical protein
MKFFPFHRVPFRKWREAKVRPEEIRSINRMRNDQPVSEWPKIHFHDPSVDVSVAALEKRW